MPVVESATRAEIDLPDHDFRSSRRTATRWRRVALHFYPQGNKAELSGGVRRSAVREPVHGAKLISTPRPRPARW